MPSKDYLPKTDGNIVPWTENFVQVASANAAALFTYSGKLEFSIPLYNPIVVPIINNLSLTVKFEKV